MTIQKQFAERAAAIVKEDDSLIGLAVGGSWITGELDDFSDLDLVVVTKEKITEDKEQMLYHANRFGPLLTHFTGEHVGEPRLLICLYDNPLLHVDIKFVTLKELEIRVEDPFILVDKEDQLNAVLQVTRASFPLPDYQWIEDRFWIWIHYALLKIARGELFETVDFLAYLRSTVLGPLLQIEAGKLPRGVRKLETSLAPSNLLLLQKTLGGLEKQSLLQALEACIQLYCHLRSKLFKSNIRLQAQTEKSVMIYLHTIKNGKDEHTHFNRQL